MTSETYLQRLHDNIKEYARARQNSERRKPYNLNVIDELHASENAHTRILVKLLQYRQDGKLPFLDSFLHELPGWQEDFGTPKAYSNIGYIDGLVHSQGKYSVIIENKIHWAADQPQQLLRYYEEIRYNQLDLGSVPENKIWIVYLTSNGLKEVTEDSLPRDLRERLDERFVPMNYCDHIIPWLKHEVLPFCPLKETALISAVQQYIDHLEGEFRTRESEHKMKTELEQTLVRILGIDSTVQGYELCRQLRENMEAAQAFLNDVSSLCSKTEKDMALPPFLQACQRSLDELYPEHQFKTEVRIDLNFIKHCCDKWNTNDIHLEWYPIKVENLLYHPVRELKLVLHVEGKTDTIEHVKKELRKRGYQTLDSGSTWFRADVPASEVPFAKMTAQQQEEFIRNTFKNARVIVDTVDAILEEMNSKQDAVDSEDGSIRN